MIASKAFSYMGKSTSTNYYPAFYFFAFAAHGEGISGSDRIFIELAKRWSTQGKVNVYVFSDGHRMGVRNGLSGKIVQYHVYTCGIFDRLGFFLQYVAKIIHALWIAARIQIEHPNDTICYSASEFWMDSLPSFVLKLRYPKIRWAASWYQTAPNPFVGFREGNRKHSYRGHALAYYLVQLPIKSLIKRFADSVLVNNTDEQKQFPKHFRHEKTIVLLGAVDTEMIRTYKEHFAAMPKTYDAVFQGRFHPQKGVVELIEIWQEVVKELPKATLVMIGDGPLMSDVKKTIKRLGLQKNVILKGYLFDGEEKYKIFAESKLVLHPSFYDSGGMAAAEAMAFGLPCVGFNLQSYTSYYPKGMMKVEIGNVHAFAKTVVELLKSTVDREKLGKEAEQIILSKYSWDVRAQEVYRRIV